MDYKEEKFRPDRAYCTSRFLAACSASSDAWPISQASALFIG